MKKIMSILALVMLVIPFTSVSAITGNYYVYSAGDVVNFYTSKNDKEGQASIILKDEGAEDQYVRVLALSTFKGSATGTNPIYDPTADADVTRLEDYAFVKAHIGEINKSAEGWPYAKPLDETLTYITLDELKTVFGAVSTDEGETYKIDVAKWAKSLEEVGVAISTSAGDVIKKGFYTSTMEGDKIWVVELAVNEEKNITDITVKKVDKTNDEYAGVPVVYFDKTYDCHSRETKDEYACYQCGNEYTWTKKGEQAATCTIVENISSKDSCVVSPKTGIKEYAVELISLAAVCGLALVLVHRKDLFKQI